MIAIINSSADAKLFKKKKWIPKLFKKPLGLFGAAPAVSFEEHPKIVEIVKHVPVIQKVEVIKPIEIIRTINIPGKKNGFLFELHNE